MKFAVRDDQLSEEPTTESGRALRGNMCWALHALSIDHTADCDVVIRAILAIEAEAREGGFNDAIKRSLEAIQRDQAEATGADSKALWVLDTVEQFQFMLREIRASERRAMVARIRAAMRENGGFEGENLDSILDEEAAR